MIMSVTASALRELHRIHRQITDLRSQLDRGPKQIRAAKSQLEHLEEASQSAKDRLQRTRLTADDKQLQLRQREDHIRDLQGKLNTCGSNREYQTLKEQIAADDQANGVLSDEILEALEAIDVQQAEVTKLDEELHHAREDVTTRVKNIEEKRGRLEAELERVLQELEAAEGNLPADFRSDYQRIARARGEDALAQVEGGTCSGCYQMISPQTLNDLMLSKPVFCTSCGALLYLPEDTSPTGV